MNTSANYEQQAQDFLASNGLSLRITLSDSKTARWSPSGHHYRVTLSRKGASGRVSFDFWDSQADMQAGKDATPYDVLACISSDYSCPETFADFCSEYGCETDSIKALQTFRRADRFARKLRAFLTETEAAQLSEIN